MLGLCYSIDSKGLALFRNGDVIMKMNETIRKYRKEQNLTQEQMANQLGISAPAVNKWENGNSYPDIELLALLARLLKIDIDTLLSFHEDLTEMEVGQFINQLSEKMSTEGFEEVFQEAETKIREFPNCNTLILWSAQILNAYLLMKYQDEEKKDTYMEKIISWFEKVAFCDDVELAKTAQISLAQNLMNHEKYEEAQKMLDKIPPMGFDKRTTQVQLFIAQEKYEEAEKMQDEMLYQRGNALVETLMHTIDMLCKKNEYEEALIYARIVSQIAEVLELGSYVGVSSYFEIYTKMQDKEHTLEYLEKMMDAFDSMYMAKTSKLYRHMKFKEEDGLDKMKQMLMQSIQTDESLEFIRGEARYQNFIHQSKHSL